MAHIKLLLSFAFLFFNLNISFSQSESNELYVWTKSGLTVRKKPLINGEKIGVIKYGEKIKIIEKTSSLYSDEVLESYQVDGEWTSNFNIGGYWVKIIFEDQEAFIFDGYLSKFPAPKYKSKVSSKMTFDNLESIEEWAEREFGVLSTSRKALPNSDYWKQTNIYNNGIIHISEGSTGWTEEVIVLPEGNLNEGFLFFELRNNFSNYYQSQYQKKADDLPKFINESINTIKINIGHDAETKIRKIGGVLIIHSKGSC